MKIEFSEFFWNPSIFPKFRCLLYQWVPHRLIYYHRVSASPTTSKLVRFFHSFVDSCIATICHHKDFTGRVLLRENFISPGNTLFHVSFFSGKVKMGLICSEWYSQSDRRKILEPPWSVLDTQPYGTKTLDIVPKFGVKWCKYSSMPNFHGGLAKLPLIFLHGWEITPHSFRRLQLDIHALNRYLFK